MLSVFLLPAFTRLGHECRGLLSPCTGVHVCTDKTSIYILIQKNFGGMESETKLTSRVCARTGWPDVRIVCVGDLASLICSFCLGVAISLSWDTLACCWDVQ